MKVGDRIIIIGIPEYFNDRDVEEIEERLSLEKVSDLIGEKGIITLIDDFEDRTTRVHLRMDKKELNTYGTHFNWIWADDCVELAEVKIDSRGNLI